MKTIAIANNKGGVGKTSSVVCTADALARMDKRVLVIDMDPQCNTTSTSRAEVEDTYTMYDFLKEECALTDTIQEPLEDGFRRYAIIPNDPLLSGRESEFIVQLPKLKLLKRSLKDLEDNYDYVLIDTPPQFGFYMTTALLASDGVVMPLDAEKYAVDGLSQLVKFINDAKIENETMRIYGALITKVDFRYAETQPFLDMMPKIGEANGFRVFKTVIRTSSDIKRSQDNVMSVYDYSKTSGSKKKSKAVEDYDNFAKELEGVIENG